MARAGDFHGRIVMNVRTPLDQHVRANGLGVVFAAAIGFQTSTNADTVWAPDAAFVRRKCVDAAGEAEGYWPGAPDLAVGVVSPNERFAEIEQKVAADWFAAGTLVVVVVNAQCTEQDLHGPALRKRGAHPLRRGGSRRWWGRTGLDAPRRRGVPVALATLPGGPRRPLLPARVGSKAQNDAGRGSTLYWEVTKRRWRSRGREPNGGPLPLSRVQQCPPKLWRAAMPTGQFRRRHESARWRPR
jgi:putative restriction endonuclease